MSVHDASESVFMMSQNMHSLYISLICNIILFAIICINTFLFQLKIPIHDHFKPSIESICIAYPHYIELLKLLFLIYFLIAFYHLPSLIVQLNHD